MAEMSFNGPIDGRNVLAGINVSGGTFNANFHGSRRDEDTQCLRDLRTTDPRDDKVRIEDTNGGLLQGSYKWIIEHSDFISWRDGSDSRLLWIKGDPGKGKTMLMCGIIDELESQTSIRPCYFFCQATDPRLNNATSVLRGLIYLLVDKNRQLLPHLQEKYDHAGASLFQDVNSWTALTQIFTKLLEDPILVYQVFMIDALDECQTDLERLLDLIVQKSANSHAKWIVSSRNWTQIEAKLGDLSQNVRLSLEVNEQAVSGAVLVYINHKVAHLKKEKKFNDETELKVREYLMANARGTFLWVALVCKELSKLKVSKRHILRKMAEFPAELGPLYGRMVQQVRDSEDDAKLCEKILRLLTVAFRPISLVELASLLNMPDEFDVEDGEEIIASCGSFLVVREDVVRFVHQSAKDFLLKETFVSEIGNLHHAIFWRSLDILSVTLRRDMYDLRRPGALIEDYTPNQDQDVLRHAHYSCVFWVDHLRDAVTMKKEMYRPSLQDEGIVHIFLKTKLLNWLEALSLIKRMPDAARTAKILENLTKSDTGLMRRLVKDVYRFIFSHKVGIELAPLQAYDSALIFSPTSSIVRQIYEETEGPKWIITKPEMPSEWTACLQTFEGHKNRISAITFSPDGTRLASGSVDGTVKVWDLETGACLHTFENHDPVQEVALSPHGMHLAAESNEAIKIWDLTTATCLTTFENVMKDSEFHTLLRFSPDGSRLAVSCCYPGLIQTWDVGTGVMLETHDFGDGTWTKTAFTPDGTHLAFISDNNGFQIQNLTTGRYLPDLDTDRNKHIRLARFSADAARLALLMPRDDTIQIFDPLTGARLQTIEASYALEDIAFSADSARLVSRSVLGHFRVWDPATGECLLQLNTGGSFWTTKSTPSPDGMLMAVVSKSNEVNLWDMAVNSASPQTPKAHDGTIEIIVFSPDGTQLAIAARYSPIKIWDPITGACLKQFESPQNDVSSMVFFPNGERLASGGFEVIEIWDVASGLRLQAIDFDDRNFESIAVSSDSALVAAAFFGTIEIWDLTTNACLQSIRYHQTSLHTDALVFSPDNTKLGLALPDNAVHIWDLNTGRRLQPFDFEHLFQDDILWGSPLRTDLRTFDLQNFINDPLAKQDSIARLKMSRFDICPEGIWILRKQEPVLWLPSEHRPSAMAVYNGSVIIGCRSGNVLFFQFPIDS